MSREQAELFIVHVRRDDVLQEKLNAARGREALAQLVQLATERGFHFTESEYREAVVAAAEGELSSESLDSLVHEMGLSPRDADA